MISGSDTGFVRNNPNLKAPNAKEYIDDATIEWRVMEMIRCMEDPIYFAEHYFYIISPGKGKHVIQMYDAQKELIWKMVNDDRVVVLASRQVGKTTAYNVFAMWLVIFHPDKKVLICANTAATALEFIGRLRLAYELIPNWLKPGITEWNKGRIAFSNDSSIEGCSTSPTSARGKSANVLILDEFAFVPNNICHEFWCSVYPVISSAKGTKVIMVSTPNGTGNIYYDTYERARLGLDKEGWTSHRIDWSEVPGRDEEWKTKTIASLNGDMRAWAQEFGNQFFGSTFTLVEGSVIKNYKDNILKNYVVPVEEHIITGQHLKVWKQPIPGRTYVLGSDVGEGVGGDYSTILVFDVTTTDNIEHVATFGSNMVSLTEFAYILVKVGSKYNYGAIVLESNGLGTGVLQSLWTTYEYENIVNYRTQKGGAMKLGIHSHNSVKVNACLWLKDMMAMPEVNITLHDKMLIQEMEYFEKKHPSAYTVFQAVPGKHDDYMIAFIWAIFTINTKIVDNYYNVLEYVMNSFGVEIPRKLESFYGSSYYGSVNGDMGSTRNYNKSDNEIDDIFNGMSGGKTSTYKKEEVTSDDSTFLGVIDDEEEDDNWL